jgi:arylsulfatase
MGFSDIGCYGGEVDTPNLNSLAKGGVRFTQFYNTARCCPSRASLLTGLHPHQADVGHMTEDDGIDGYLGDLSPESATIAEVLKGSGYSTYMSGKWHVTGFVDGPKHNWPRSRGFDEYYGIIGGASSYYNPCSLTRNNERIETPPGEYYITDVISDEAIAQIRSHPEKGEGRPFFQYVAYTAPHWPLHAYPEDIAKYKGRFDRGWDVLREERLARMVEMGVVDASWKLSPRHPRQPAWPDAEDKEWQARRMEVYAAQIDRMDQGIGRILDALRETGQMENTLIMFLADNGGCAEEVMPDWDRWTVGHCSTATTRDGRPVRFGNVPEIMPGDEGTYQSCGLPWANVSDTPFRKYKHWVHEGGISTPFIMHWPAEIKDADSLRHTPAQLPDVMATCVEVSGAEYPAVRDGHQVQPLEGYSMMPIVEGGQFGRPALFWEHEGNCAVRRGRWKLVCEHPEDWELYDMAADRTELNNVATQHPDVVQELKTLYNEWANRCKVVPWQKMLEIKRQKSSPT